MSLLRKPNEPLPVGCYCAPGRCMAPKVMGRQTPCRDPLKAAGVVPFPESLERVDWRAVVDAVQEHFAVRKFEEKQKRHEWDRTKVLDNRSKNG